jgi:formylglycine-generating enzyme required for sulfatase activity
MAKNISLMVILAAVLALAGCLNAGEGIEAGEARIRIIDGMEMVYVPGGYFWMGSAEEDVLDALEQCSLYWDHCSQDQFADESPSHKVFLDGFWIDRTEVSNQQYQRCIDAGVCHPSRCRDGLQFDGPDQPVVCINWKEAGNYCGWIGGRLPSEAEWEYAARGQTGAIYPWGDVFDGTRLNYCDQSCGRPRSDATFNDGQYYSAPVGTYPEGASWCGALDMAGNVSEWVEDGFAKYGSRTERNPAGPLQAETRVIRGGSWFMSPVETRSAWRQGLPQDNWFDDLGFRCLVPEE